MKKTTQKLNSYDLSDTEVDYLAPHHIETAKRLRAEAFNEIFGGLSASIKGFFVRPRPETGRPLAQSLR